MTEMKRFIDLRGQIYNDDDLPKEEQEIVFAFFCTVKDEFLSFSNSYAWDCVDDFKRDYMLDYDTDDLIMLERLLALIPSWVPEV